MDKQEYDKKINEWTSLSGRIEDHFDFCECDLCMKFLRLGDELANVELDDETVDEILENLPDCEPERVERVREKLSRLGQPEGK